MFGIEKLGERLDPADDENDVVLPAEREHRVDEIMPRPLFAKLDF